MSNYKEIERFLSKNIWYIKLQPSTLDPKREIKYIEIWSPQANDCFTNFKNQPRKLIVFYNDQEQVSDLVNFRYKVTVELYQFIIHNAHDMNIITQEAGEAIVKIANRIITEESEKVREEIMRTAPRRIGLSIFSFHNKKAILVVDIEKRKVIDIVHFKKSEKRSRILKAS